MSSRKDMQRLLRRVGRLSSSEGSGSSTPVEAQGIPRPRNFRSGSEKAKPQIDVKQSTRGMCYIALQVVID
ncbi:unnamed protein product [Lupinus luteus]|uniref:Uncharacterized protein n=1 Tax=Lupinus luteus TaxID=3873 RepID=A0AAV1XQ89_LUPLU